MRYLTSLFAAGALAISGGLVSSDNANAAPQSSIAPLVHTGAEADIELIRDRRPVDRQGYRHYRGRHHGWHWHRHHRDRDRRRAATAGIIGFGAGALLGGALAQPRTQYRTYAGMPQAHVQWCQQRYRSYDVGTDTFLSYDGNRYRCNSPYVSY